MATILDPDNLFDNAVDSAGANIYIDTALRTIKIRNNSGAPKGPVLDETGVTLQALYSFLKEEWKDDPNNKSLIAYPFPLIAITPEQFEWRFGWTPADDSSRTLLRTAGWREYAVNNTTLQREYLGVITLGNIDGDQNQDGLGDQDKAYYAFFDSATLAPMTSAADFDFPGPVNQAILTYLDTDADGTPDFDRRGDIVTVFIRQEGKTYGQTRTTEIGLSAGTTLPYNVQRFPLSEGTDLDVTVSDATILANDGAGEKYDVANDNGPTISFLSSPVASNTLGYTKDLSGGPFNFGILINAEDGTGAGNLTKNEVYSWVQYSLRQNVNIDQQGADATDQIGKLTDELLEFVGPTLKTKNATNLDGGGSGVAITNFLSTDVNDLAFRDNNEDEQTFPFTAAGTISFSNEILQDGANAKFFLYYDYTHAYTGNIAISAAGTSSLDASVDSAIFTISGFTPNPVTTGVNSVTLGVDDYFRLTGASNSGNNQIWKVTNKSAPSATSFSAITYDDVPAVNETTFSGSIRTYPINSPQATLVDSAGTSVENTGGIASTLAAGNLTNGTYIFEYDYDGNTQYDREASQPAAIVIRAIGLDNGSFVELGNQTIAQSTTNSYSVVSAVERNYANP